MNVCVINGSPKGKYSCTLQTCLYLQSVYPNNRYEFVDVAKKLRIYEQDMKPVIDCMKRADLILFSYPIYTFLVPSQLHRFIELLKEQKTDWSDKFVTQITTSKHFYDVTAHQFMEDNFHDLKMKVIHGLSADMEDLLKPEGQQDAKKFFDYVTYCVSHEVYEAPKHPVTPPKDYQASFSVTPKKEGQDIVIVTDLLKDDLALKNMIQDFQNLYPYSTRIINIREYPFKGGCIGCFHCAGDGKCIYQDHFDEYLRNNIQTADAVIYAFTIKDHSMGSQFKMYDDRQFCNGHRTVTEGKPFGYIVHGSIEEEPNLKLVIEGRSEVGHNFLAGIAFDAKTLRQLSDRLEFALSTNYVQPRNFYGVGGMKIFRDMIWLMRGMMKADHEYYKAHGAYDFPQKERGKMLKMCFLGSLVRNKKIRAKMGNKLNEGMIAPYKKVIQKVKLEENNKKKQKAKVTK